MIIFECFLEESLLSRWRSSMGIYLLLRSGIAYFNVKIILHFFLPNFINKNLRSFYFDVFKCSI